MTEIMNMILMFYSSCDFNNNFIDTELNPNLMMEVDYEAEEVLDKCANDFISTGEIKECLPIC